MKLVIGIGNPEVKYKNTRHNVGLMVADELISRGRVKDLVVKRSDKFMNHSGSFVLSQSTKYHIQYTDLYVIHDDLDIPIGSFKIQFGKGPKVHNGLNDIYEKIGSSDFWHVRVGVDNRDPENRIEGKSYVLEDFTEEERIKLTGVIKQICNQLVI
ncbi:aminoacyl-tRNA hydrolase [Patescibacteria group bacterium]|nr:aminoacyl-tRNA hydrolase [Patescibacteria group bacterium]